jgi:uncharacterized protein (DUF1800 family)
MALSDFTTPISSWDAQAVMHFARRAGFGIRPDHAATLAAQDPATVIDGWLDGTVAAAPSPSDSASLFGAVLASRADVVSQAQVNANTSVAGAVTVPAVPAPHGFLTEGANAWRNSLSAGQAQCTWRMQFAPFPFRERLALFWHNLFATGQHKVDNIALMLKQYELFRSVGLGHFGDLLVAVSKDPAMALWLDSVTNNAAGTSVPNENYAREAMELYSLGVDNGYNQTDITQLARALSGWSFVIPNASWVPNPASPNSFKAVDALFTVYQGQALPANSRAWYGGTPANLGRMHPTGAANDITTINLQWQSGISLINPPAGQAPGESALRSILTGRATECSEFLAKRLLLHFVTPDFSTQDYQDLGSLIRSANFDMAAVLKTLFKSTYFFMNDKRFALVEGPVSWIVRAARMLGPDLATADGQSPKGFPAWRSMTNPYFDQAGMKLLDPSGPNGWKEHGAWLNSNTVRYRTKLASALTLAETFNTGSETVTLFPTNVDSWFAVAPATALDVYDRLVALLQPGPIPSAVRDAWLAALWPASFTWDATAKIKARELAFLVLCSPAAQLY